METDIFLAKVSESRSQQVQEKINYKLIPCVFQTSEFFSSGNKLKYGCNLLVKMISLAKSSLQVATSLWTVNQSRLLFLCYLKLNKLIYFSTIWKKTNYFHILIFSLWERSGTLEIWKFFHTYSFILCLSLVCCIRGFLLNQSLLRLKLQLLLMFMFTEICILDERITWSEDPWTQFISVYFKYFKIHKK